MPQPWMEHIFARYISGSSGQHTNLPELEQDFATFYKMMSFKDIKEWDNHVMDTLHQEHRAKVMLSREGIFVTCSQVTHFHSGKQAFRVGQGRAISCHAAITV